MLYNHDIGLKNLFIHFIIKLPLLPIKKKQFIIIIKKHIITQLLLL